MPESNVKKVMVPVPRPWLTGPISGREIEVAVNDFQKSLTAKLSEEFPNASIAVRITRGFEESTIVDFEDESSIDPAKIEEIEETIENIRNQVKAESPLQGITEQAHIREG